MATQQQLKDQPWDEIDFVLMIATAIVPPHWPWALLLAAEAITRRNPRVAAYVMDALNVERVPTWLLPGAAALPDDRDCKTIEMPRMSMPRLGGLLPARERQPEPVVNPTGASFTPQPERPARPAASAPRRQAATLTPDRFAEDPLFRAINEEPHRLVIGHSTGGKSTAMHAMVQAWAHQGREVYVLDPDAANGSWPGARQVAGYAEDYDGIGRTLDTLRDLFEDRSELYAAGQREFEPVHIVADEVHETIRNVPGARDFLFETVGRRGAKRGILLTLGTQGNNVDELDLDSAGVLNNFITAEFEKNEKGRRVATVYRGNAARKKRMQQFMVPALTPAKDYVRPAEIIEARQLPLPQPAATHTTTNLQAPDAAPDPFLAELLAQQLMATMTPERAARLQAAMGQQSVSVARDSGDVNVIVQQVSAPSRAPTRRSATGINVRDRRRRLAYIDAARAGDKFEPTYRRLGGNRNEMHSLFAKNRVSPQ